MLRILMGAVCPEGQSQNSTEHRSHSGGKRDAVYYGYIVQWYGLFLLLKMSRTEYSCFRSFFLVTFSYEQLPLLVQTFTVPPNDGVEK